MTPDTCNIAAPAIPAVRTVAFTISGETITSFARGLVVEGDWDRALSFLLSEIEGMTYEIAIGIISGRMKLVGTGNSPDGITLEDDDDRGYLDQLAEMMVGLVRFQGSWWRARSTVIRLGRRDRIAAETQSIRPVKTVEYDDSFVGGPCDLRYENACVRALFYAGDSELVTLAKIQDDKGRERCLPVIFTPTGKPPIWLQGDLPNDLETAARNASDAFALEFVGAAEDEMVPAEAAKHRMAEAAASRPSLDELLVTWKARILEQAAGDIIEVDLPGGPYNIPRKPLMRWALRRIDRIALPAWSAVCHSGIKLQNDDPEHTDWIVGGGIALELYDDQEFKTAQYELKARLQQEYAGFEVAVLHGADCGFITGTARVIKRPRDADPASITRSTILVIPQADARFLEHALNAGAVICAAGGEMAHLVTVLREHSLPILMYRNALRDIQDGTRLIAWPKEGRIDLTALPTA